MKKNLISAFILALIIVLTISCTPSQPTGTMSLTKNEFAPGEQIKVTFTATGKYGERPWIGIIPSNLPHGDESKNDENDVSFQYFDGLTNGELVFEAPSLGGDYDFRMHSTDNNGIEVTSVSFKVVAPKVDVSISLDKSEYEPGEQIVIKFTAPAEFSENAWIGIIPSETPHGNEADNDAADLNFGYLQHKTSGELTFAAPEKPGSYDARMNDSDSDGKEVASVTFTVK